MPIKDPTIYPRHWEQFSLYIRTERSDGKCEVCGIENGAIGNRDFDGTWFYNPGYEAAKENGVGFYVTTGWKKIVLTVAHLDAVGDICRCQDATGFLCANPAHVLAMCQRCHNRYDSPKRMGNAKLTNELKKDAARGLLEAN